MAKRNGEDTTEGSIGAGIDWAWVKDQVLSRERIPSGARSSSGATLRDAVDECMRVARHIAKPRTARTRKDILEISEKAVRMDGGLSLSSAYLASHMRGATHTELFLVTIGSDLEETATMLMESGEQLHGYLLDRIGSFAVESLAADLEEKLRRKCGSGKMSVSMRFSPGYCDWAIEEQFLLGKALDFSRAGVRLTESCMMIPRKSISGLIGIGPKGLFSKTGSQCVTCDKTECGYRRGD